MSQLQKTLRVPRRFLSILVAPLVFLGSIQLTSPASAIVLIDDFNYSPISLDLAPFTGFGGEFSVGDGIGSIVYDAGQYGVLGEGTIGSGGDNTGARRIGVLKTNSGNSTAINVNQQLTMALTGTTGPKEARVAWDGTSNIARVAGSIDENSSTLTNLNFAGGVLGGAGGLTHDATGIWLEGVTMSAVTGSTFVKLAVLVNNSEYAYWSIAGSALAALGTDLDIYIPFNGGEVFANEVGTGIAGFDLVGLSATVQSVFGGAKAIVLELSGTGSGTLALDSIYAFTPEPASLIMWSVLGLLGFVRMGRRKSVVNSSSSSAANLNALSC